MDIPEVGTAEYTEKSFTSTSSVASNSRTIGSKHVVTVAGTGFYSGQVVSVQIGGAPTDCGSTGYEVSYDTLTCITHPNGSIATGSTPVVTGITRNQFTIMGGEEFTISGFGFDGQSGVDCNSNGEVIVGNAEAVVTSWTSTEIVAVSSKRETFGASDVVVYVCNKGNSNSMTASTPLMITSVDGTFSSLMGGRDIVINGAGFDSDTGNAADSFDVWLAASHEMSQVSPIIRLLVQLMLMTILSN